MADGRAQLGEGEEAGRLGSGGLHLLGGWLGLGWLARAGVGGTGQLLVGLAPGQGRLGAWSASSEFMSFGTAGEAQYRQYRQYGSVE